MAMSYELADTPIWFARSWPQAAAISTPRE
jgi:hypothetical protein